MTLLVLAALPVLFGLGRWQLLRADEKRLVQQAFETARAATPLDISQLPSPPQQYARVRLKGHYDNTRSFLLDNRISHGRFGYEILTPFFVDSTAAVVLVNRGWVEGDPARLKRPVIESVEGRVELTGSVYRDTAKRYFVENSHESHWPKLIQNLKTDDLEKQLGMAILPFTVRLDANLPGAYATEWRVLANALGPEQHVAYAVTWFTLAAVLIVIWAVSNSNFAQWIKRGSHDE